MASTNWKNSILLLLLSTFVVRIKFLRVFYEFRKLFWPTVRKNCSSDWDFFWNLRLKAPNLQAFWNHKNNLFKLWKFRTILSWYVLGKLEFQFKKNYCNVKTYRNILQNCVLFRKLLLLTVATERIKIFYLWGKIY